MKIKLNTRCRSRFITPDVIIEKLNIIDKIDGNGVAYKKNKKNESALIKQVEKIIKNNAIKPIDTRALLKHSTIKEP